jgi:predicted adenine nucleotide alpha hydrolase (AANH) superfamily ATPase
LRLLLHCCCGPCALVTADHLRSPNTTVVGWFYNPNVHPPEERARRAATMAAAATSAGLAMLPDGPDVALADLLLSLARAGGPRCPACYLLRLHATARKASEEGFGAFSSTLEISPHQDLDAIAEVGREAGAAVGVEFRFADLRGRYGESCERARDLGLYRQNYCGCLFSGLERAARRVRRVVGRASAGPTG